MSQMTAIQDTARQILVHGFGGPDVLELHDVAVSEPADGELLIRVLAAGVLYGDVMRRTDRYVAPTPLPYAPGTEVAGLVVAVGRGVADFAVGDRVASRVPSSGYAQYAIAQATNATVLPDGIAFDVATALLAQGLTAWLLTHDIVPLAGKTVFIDAAAGGVGAQMVQMARMLGASRIIGAASSPHKRDFAASIGADLTIDTAEREWSQHVLEVTGGQGVDVGFESSGAAFKELLGCLSPFGTLVKFGRGISEHQTIEPWSLLSKNQSLRGFYLPGYFNPENAARMASVTRALFDATLAGTLKIRIDHRYTLDEAALAHRAIEGRATIGKVVIEPWRAV